MLVDGVIMKSINFIKGVFGMTQNEIDLINLIRNSDDPEKVATYMFNLFLDYLRTNVPSQESLSASPRVSSGTT